MREHLYVNPEVKRALDAGQPVVALESTLITHGLPHPINVDIALQMESAVRESGAVPATIAVLEGIITVGITDDQIRALAGRPAGTVRKCSRRDLPIAIANREDGATTVAATMIVANSVDIMVFATGGIGGVHRGQPHDVSADLIELGRTPVAVVCSGPKSILDLALTLEVLETQGVPVLGFRTDVLPAFYSSHTDLQVDQRIDSTVDAARIIAAAKSIGAQHGVLVNVPVPEEHALDIGIAEAAIEQATSEAEQAGIAGKNVTPYVLSRVSKLTDGKSRAANIALLTNNARIAGQIAADLCQL